MKIKTIIGAIILSLTLAGCIPLIIGGAAGVGGVWAAHHYKVVKITPTPTATPSK